MAVLALGSHYTVSIAITNPGAVTNLAIMAHATRPFVLIRAKITLAQATIPAAANAAVELVRFTAAPTVTSIAASTFINHDQNGADAGFTAGHTASVAGTVGDTYLEGWGSSTGWLYDWPPTPEEYILVAAGTANGIGIRHTTAPPAGVYRFLMTAVEIG